MPDKKKIEKRHAALAAKRVQEKKADPTCDFGSVTELMKRAANELAALPDDVEYSADALDRLEEVRHQAIRLRHEVEAIFDSLTGKQSQRDHDRWADNEEAEGR